MTYDASVNIDTRMDAQGMNQGIKEIQDSLNNLQGTLGKLGQALGIGLSVEKVIDFGAACVEAGAESKAANAQFAQVFGSLRDEAEQSLDTIAEQAGSTASAMRGCYNQIAAFAKTTGMSTEDALDLTNRAMIAAADSAAFYDRSLSEVTENLQSFLKGNYENDAALGLSCTETTRNAAANALYSKSFQNLSETQKELTLMQMVEDANKLSGAMGQAAREADSWTSQTQLLKDQFKELMSLIGSDMLLALAPLVKTINEILSTLLQTYKAVRSFFYNLFGIEMEDVSAASSAVDNLADTTSNAADAAGDLADSTGDVADATGDLADATKDAAEAQKDLLGFDQITKLTAATNSGSGGGSGGGGGGSGGDVGGSSGVADKVTDALGTTIPESTENALNQSSEVLDKWFETVRELLLDALKEYLDLIKWFAEQVGDLLGTIWDGCMDALGAVADLLDALPDIDLPDLTIAPKWDKNAEKQMIDQLEQLQQEIENGFSAIVFDLDITNIQNNLSAVNVLVQESGQSARTAGSWWDALKNRIQAFLDKYPLIKDVFGLFESSFNFWATALEPAIIGWEGLAAWMDDIVVSITHINNAATELIKGDLIGTLDELAAGLTNLPGVKLAVSLVKSGWDTLEKWVGKIPTLSQLIKLVKDGWSTVSHWIGNLPGISQAIKLAKSGWSSVKSWVGTIPVLSAGIKLVKSGWSTLKKWLGDLTVKLNIKIPKISVSWGTTTKLGVSIPWPKFSVRWYAKGGILNGAQIFGMAGNTLLGGGEAGREAVLPLDRNTGWMDTLASRIVAQIGSGGGKLTVQVTLDGKVVGQTTVDYLRNQAKQGYYPLSGVV